LSTSPSARLLCDIVERPPMANNGVGIIANPDGSLPAAGLEAAAIQQAFHPGGRLFGQIRSEDGDWWTAPDGAGTAAEVLELIEGSGASRLLHLACHAVADQAHPDRSRLLLAGGAELPVHRLLSHRRVGHLALDQVFLAACTTHLAGLDYDEAFSLASAFLVAGARTVFGSLWPIADNEASVFMYLLHRYQHDGLPPLPALHQAQAWMLNPNRQPPPGMPPELAGRLDRPVLADPLAWAGFVHLGR